MTLFKVKWRSVNRDLWQRLVFSIIMLLIPVVVVGIVIISLMPPLTLSIEQILAMRSSSNEFQRYNIEVTSTVNMDTAYTVTRWKGPIQTSSETTHYGVLAIGDRLLMISSEDRIDETKTSYTGAFYNQLPEKVRDSLEHYPDFQRQLLPVYFAEGNRLRRSEFLGAAIMIIGCSIIGIIGTRRVIAELPFSEAS